MLGVALSASGTDGRAWLHMQTERKRLTSGMNSELSNILAGKAMWGKAGWD